METNQKDLQKKRIKTAVFVVIVIALLCCMITTIILGKEISKIKKQMGLSRLTQTSAESVGGISSENLQKEEGQQAKPHIITSKIPENDVAPEPDVKHKVYLTFDDGPSKQTELILDILDEYDVKATFFVVGKDGDEAVKRLQMIYERGHTVGMHSYSHDYTDIYESEDAFRSDFLKCKQYIYDAIGVETKVFRFPGGSSNKLGKTDMNVFVDFLKEQGVEYYDWNISSGDGGGNLMPAEVIVDNCIKNISRHDTSIILMHDSAGKTTTVEALPYILEAITDMEDVAILPITEATNPVHHVIKTREAAEGSDETAKADTKEP